MSRNHRAIVAAAGSGKTQELICRALHQARDERVLITTYTDNGTNEITSRIIQHVGRMPANVVVMSWYSFLLRHAIKPFQHSLFDINEVRTINFITKPMWRIPKKDIRRYFLDSQGNVYRDRVTDLALKLDGISGGAVSRRIAGIFGGFYLDEVQDMSGHDFGFLESLMAVVGSVVMVGDPRQGTYSTTRSRKSSHFTRSKILNWLNQLEGRGVLEIESQSESHRCVQAICDYADSLFDGFDPTKSLNESTTGHDGVFLLRTRDVNDYVNRYAPQVLAWDRQSDTFGVPSRNMGDVKGLSFERVLIVPTETMKDFLQRNVQLAEITRAKFYVAVTRAKQSVAIALDRPGACAIPYWTP